MSYFVQFNPESGCLIDVSPSESFNITDPHLVIEEREGEIPMFPDVLWDWNTRELVARKQRTMSKLVFLLLFSMGERVTIENSADPIIKDFLTILDHISLVNLDDPLTVQAVNYMAQQGIIDMYRVQEILS